MAEKKKTPDAAASSSAKATEDKTPPQPSYEELEKQVAELTTQKAVQTEREQRIQEKMLKGLSRPQSIAVLDRQDAYDNSPIAKARAERLAKLKTSQS